MAKKAAAGAKASPAAVQAYVSALRQAWGDGNLSKDEEVLLATLRKSLGITPEEHAGLEQEIQLEIYLEAVVNGWKDGSISPEDSEHLDELREKFRISAEEHLRMEKQV